MNLQTLRLAFNAGGFLFGVASLAYVVYVAGLMMARA